MSREALLAALRREEELQWTALQQQQAAAEAALRQEYDQQLARLRQEQAQRLQRVAAQVQGELAAQAAASVRLLRQQAQQALAQRLWVQARQLLPSLRQSDPGAVLAALARELPEGRWLRVRVAAADLTLARTLFPAAQVEVDPALSGGLLAQSADGRMLVDNSLDKRLQRLWPELLPLLLRHLTEETDAPAEPG